MTIDNLSNYSIAPSYSEAILIERIYSTNENETTKLTTTNGIMFDNNNVNQNQNSQSATIPLIKSKKLPSNTINTDLDLPSYEEVIMNNINNQYTKVNGFKNYITNLFETFNSKSLLKRSNTINNGSFRKYFTNQLDFKPWCSLQNVSSITNL